MDVPPGALSIPFLSQVSKLTWGLLVLRVSTCGSPRPKQACGSLQAQARNITANWFQEAGGLQARVEDIVIAQAKGIDCFDWDFYKSKNPDVAKLPRAAQWDHFLRRGAVEFREHRWLCGLNADSVMGKD